MNQKRLFKWMIPLLVLALLGCLRSSQVEPLKATEIVIATTSTTSSTTTTSTTTTTLSVDNISDAINTVIECPPDKVCPVCADCNLTLTGEQIRWLLNLHPAEGATSYQTGYFDCADTVREYLQVPGRPRFSSRPSRGFADLYANSRKTDDGLYCFKDLGGYFNLSRAAQVYVNANGENLTRYNWGWSDEQCLTSSLLVKHL